MQKLILTTCKICGVTKTPRGIGQHVFKSHCITLNDYIVKYEFNQVHPKCKCGCGENVTIRGFQVMDYIDGHCPTGHFKTGINPRKNIDQWRENVTKGIRNYNSLEKINNPEYRKGKNNNFYGKKHKEETKNLIREKIREQIDLGNHPFIGNINGRIGKSSLEIKFENYLIENNIIYQHNYKIAYVAETPNSVRYKYFDFYIPIINTVVEIHGSYWHPKKNENLSEMQINNLKNDSFKKQLAKDHHYTILTIYDSELDNFISDNTLLKIIDEFSKNKISLAFSGYLKNSDTIELPDYWTKLVDPESITVNLTPVGSHQNLYVRDFTDNQIVIGIDGLFKKTIDCFYTVYAERCDVEKLQVEVF